MSNDKFRNYLLELGLLLKEKAQEAKKEKDHLATQDHKDYNIGYLMTYHEVIDLMKQ